MSNITQIPLYNYQTKGYQIFIEEYGIYQLVVIGGGGGLRGAT
jgi:hypothetical protein